MAVSNIPLLTGATLLADTSAGATAVAAKASSATLYEMELDNTANAAATYFKLYNAAAAGVTVGTTVPDSVHMVPASTKLTHVIPAGNVWGTALTYAAVTTGGTAGTTAPTSAFAVKLVYV